MTLWLWNLAAYSVQLAVLIATAVAITTLVPLRVPSAALRFWQAVFVVSLSLPLAMLWQVSTDTALAASVISFTSSTFGDDPASSRVGIVTLMLIAVAAGAGVRLLWLVAGLVRLRSITARSVAAPALDDLFASLQRELQTNAALRISSEIDGPATVGVIRPAVLLPPNALDLSEPVQRAVLCHELIHVRRRDWINTIVEELWCALLWFHPGARVLASRLGLAREMLVDRAAVAHTRNRRAYATALLEFSDPPPQLLGATPLIGRRHIAQRIACIAEEVSMSRTRIVSRLTLAVIVAGLATIAAGAYVPVTAALGAQAGKVFTAKDGVTLPSVVHEVKPDYTPEAMQAGIQGSMEMSVVVLASGEVGTVTVTKSLDKEYGLDEKAVEAARQWKFKPGMKDDKPVDVEVTLEMRFTLKK